MIFDEKDEFLLCNVYVPNKDDPEFVMNLIEQLEGMDVPEKIIGGDFNLVYDPEIDRYGSTANHKNANELLQT